MRSHFIVRDIDGDMWCEDCGEVVDAEEWYDEDTGYTENHCLCCGGEDVSRPEECEICGEKISPTEHLCEGCKEDIDILLNYAVVRLRENRKMTISQARNYFGERLEELEG